MMWSIVPLLLACVPADAPPNPPSATPDTGADTAPPTDTAVYTGVPRLLGHIDITNADASASPGADGGFFGFPLSTGCDWGANAERLLVSESDSLSPDGAWNGRAWLYGQGDVRQIYNGYAQDAGFNGAAAGWTCTETGFLANLNTGASGVEVFGAVGLHSHSLQNAFNEDITSIVNFRLFTPRGLQEGREAATLGHFSGEPIQQAAVQLRGLTAADPSHMMGVYDLVPGDVNADEDAVARVLFSNGQNSLSPRVPAGDYNGDGFDDLCTIELVEDDVALFYGPLQGDYERAEAPGRILRDPDAELMTFSSCGNIGDIDGDGEDDFAIGAADTGAFAGGTRTWFGGIAVFLDPPQGELLASEADIIFRIDEEDFGPITSVFQPVGDLNGDGYDDVVYTGYAWNEAFIFYGPITERGEISHHDADATIGGAIFKHIAAGDLNGDGINDLVLSDFLYDDRGAVWVFHGGSVEAP